MTNAYVKRVYDEFVKRNANEPEQRYEGDVVVVAIGQAIETAPFEEEGVPSKRGVLIAEETAIIPAMPNVYAGGDCVTGPATVIRAIAAGKAAAAKAKEVTLGKMNLDHIQAYAEELKSAGLQEEGVSPLLLPNYARHER